MKKVVITALILSLNGLFGMQEDKEEVDLHPYKKLFFKWYGNGPIGTEERWEEFKRGVLNGAITLTAIQNAPPPWGTIKYYLAYSKEVLLDNKVVARFMYPSPNSVYSGYPIEGTDKLYTIDSDNMSGPLFLSQIWNTNDGVDNAGYIPLALHPPKEYFSDWVNNSKVWAFSTTINNTGN